MIRNTFKKKILILLLVLFAISLLNIIPKVIMDYNNSKVELAISYNNILKLSSLCGVSRENMILELKSKGITTVLVYEDTFSSLAEQGKLTHLKGNELLNISRVVPKASNSLFSKIPSGTQLNPFNTYVEIEEVLLSEMVKIALVIRLGDRAIKDHGNGLLEIACDNKVLSDLPLDIDIEKAKFISDAGLKVLPVIFNDSFFSEDQISYKLIRLKDFKIKSLLLGGEEALGFPTNLAYVAKTFAENNMEIAYLEFAEKPLGISNLAKVMPKHLNKIHKLNIITTNKNKYIAESLRAVRERNCRIILLDFDNTMNLQNWHTFYSEVLSGIEKSLSGAGYQISINQLNPYKNYKNYSLYLVSYLASLLLGWMFVKLFFSTPKIKYILGGAIFLCASLLVVYLKNDLAGVNSVVALFLAIMSPVLIFAKVEKLLGSIPKLNIKLLAGIILFVLISSLICGTLIQNLFWEPRFFWGIDFFRGIKISLLLPLFFLGILFFIKTDRLKYSYYIIKRGLNSNITYGILGIVFLLIIILFFYILRSGNYGILLGGQNELATRNFLESVFIYRPRSKEFLFAYPLLVLIFAFREKINYKLKNILLLFASMSSISIINSFVHLHTPYLVTIYRSSLSALLGFGIGLCLVLVINKIIKHV